MISSKSKENVVQVLINHTMKEIIDGFNRNDTAILADYLKTSIVDFERHGDLVINGNNLSELALKEKSNKELLSDDTAINEHNMDNVYDTIISNPVIRKFIKHACNQRGLDLIPISILNPYMTSKAGFHIQQNNRKAQFTEKGDTCSFIGKVDFGTIIIPLLAPSDNDQLIGGLPNDLISIEIRLDIKDIGDNKIAVDYISHNLKFNKSYITKIKQELKDLQIDESYKTNLVTMSAAITGGFLITPVIMAILAVKASNANENKNYYMASSIIVATMMLSLIGLSIYSAVKVHHSNAVSNIPPDERDAKIKALKAQVDILEKVKDEAMLFAPNAKLSDEQREKIMSAFTLKNGKKKDDKDPDLKDFDVPSKDEITEIKQKSHSVQLKEDSEIHSQPSSLAGFDMLDSLSINTSEMKRSPSETDIRNDKSKDEGSHKVTFISDTKATKVNNDSKEKGQ